MPHRFLPALPALFLGLLAACETSIDTSDELSLQVEPTVRAIRCLQCGRIQSKREIRPGVADPHSPGIYEYTVRMADGSSSVFQEALPTTWRVGERLTVINGAGPLN